MVLKVILESVSLKSMEFTTLKTPTKNGLSSHIIPYLIIVSTWGENSSVMSASYHI